MVLEGALEADNRLEVGKSGPQYLMVFKPNHFSSENLKKRGCVQKVLAAFGTARLRRMTDQADSGVKNSACSLTETSPKGEAYALF